MIRSRLWPVAIASLLTMRTGLAAVDDPIRLELNTLENADDRCRLSFVTENKANAQVDSLRLELAVFNREGMVQRRVATEMGPVRGQKTVVKTFTVDGVCNEIGSILLNDVTACTPGDAESCLDRLVLSSRVKEVRFYK